MLKTFDYLGKTFTPMGYLLPQTDFAGIIEHCKVVRMATFRDDLWNYQEFQLQASSAYVYGVQVFKMDNQIVLPSKNTLFFFGGEFQPIELKPFFATIQVLLSSENQQLAEALLDSGLKMLLEEGFIRTWDYLNTPTGGKYCIDEIAVDPNNRFSDDELLSQISGIIYRGGQEIA